MHPWRSEHLARTVAVAVAVVAMAGLVLMALGEHGPATVLIGLAVITCGLPHRIRVRQQGT